MGLIDQLVPGHTPSVADSPYAQPVEGKVLRSVSSVTAGMYVTVTPLDGDRLEWGPLPWQPRVEPVTEPDGMLVCRIVYPQAGDRALIVFEGEGHNPWAQWWPVGRGYEDTRV